MLQAIRARRDDEGFTLIELMVVVLIIAILIAIAIPTFLGARERAQERGAQSNLRNALTAAKVIFSDTGTYDSATHTVAALEAVEPSLTWLAEAAPAAGATAVDVGWVVTADGLATSTFTAAALSDSGDCFYIQDVGNAGTTYGRTTTGTEVSCDPDTPAALSADGW